MNKLAPVSVKLKVLKSCVMTTLLYNCESFGPEIPEGLEQVYFRMLRAALGVRSNCPNLILLMESGFLPLKCVIHMRQLNFFQRFQASLKPNSTRSEIFKYLLDNNNSTKFIKHYVELDRKYPDVKTLVQEQIDIVKSSIRNKGADRNAHYKFWIYLQMNPELVESPFLQRIDAVGKCITKFRLGSHNLPIETGRWKRTQRQDRLCATCGVLGDEFHFVYNCCVIPRGEIGSLPRTFSEMWTFEGVNRLFKYMMKEKLIDL